MTTVINNLASGSSPTMYYDVDITETGRASTTVTYSVKVSAWLSSQTYDFFSAHVYPKVVVGNQTLNFTLGTFPKGAGTKTQTLTATVTNVTASSSSVSWTFSATQELGGTSSSSTGYVSARSGTVACSVYASVPTFSGSITLKEGGTITRTAYFPEDWSATDTFLVDYPTATVPSGQSVKYQIEWSTNSGASYTVLSSTTTAGTYTHTPGTGFSNIRYRVKAMNAADTTQDSGYLYSSTLNKNVMNAPNLTSSSAPTYGTGTITLSLTAATDSLGSAMTYTIAGTSGKWTTLSGTTTTGTGTITINLSTADTAATTGTYMTWANMKLAALAGGTASDTNDYKGSIDITITAKNAYNTTKTDTVSIVLDLGVNAPVVDTPTITVDTTTTSMYAVNGTNYYFPKQRPVKLTLSSNNATPSATILDKLGRKCSFDINYTSGGVTTFIKNVAASTASTTVNDVDLDMTTMVVTGTTSSGKAMTFTAVAKTYNGVTLSSAATGSVTMHYWASPSVTYKNLIRNATSSTFDVTVTRNTSLYISTADTKTVKNGTTTWGTYVDSASYPATAYQYTFTTTSPALLDTDTLTVTVTGLDPVGTALAQAATSMSVVIPTFVPALAVRNNGIGVNAIPDGTAQLMVGGAINSTTTITGKHLTAQHTGGQYLSLNDSSFVSGTTGMYNYTGYNDGSGAWKAYTGFGSGRDNIFNVYNTLGDIKITSTVGNITLTTVAGGTVNTGAAEVVSAKGLTVSDPNNASATVGLNWLNDIARIRYGGSGAGSAGGFQIQGTGDAIKWKIDNTGNMTVYGNVYGTKDLVELWDGAYYMNETQTVTPSIPLNQCPTGWLFAWSDYSAGVANNYDYVYTMVARNHATLWNSFGTHHLVSSNTATNYAYLDSKYLYVSNTSFSGHTTNDEGTNSTIVLRKVFMF